MHEKNNFCKYEVYLVYANTWEEGVLQLNFSKCFSIFFNEISTFYRMRWILYNFYFSDGISDKIEKKSVLSINFWHRYKKSKIMKKKYLIHYKTWQNYFVCFIYLIFLVYKLFYNWVIFPYAIFYFITHSDVEVLSLPKHKICPYLEVLT